MSSLGSGPARPRDRVVVPLYPRLIGLGLMLAASACGGSVEEGREAPAAGGAGGSGGTTAQDAGDEGTAGTGGAVETGGTGGELGGAAPYPYDAGTEEAAAQPDATDEGEPNPAGDIAEPFDAGTDSWSSTIDAESDAYAAGFAPEPYDAESCETGPIPPS